jgi:hypothetical protein
MSTADKDAPLSLRDVFETAALAVGFIGSAGLVFTHGQPSLQTASSVAMGAGFSVAYLLKR